MSDLMFAITVKMMLCLLGGLLLGFAFGVSIGWNWCVRSMEEKQGE